MHQICNMISSSFQAVSLFINKGNDLFFTEAANTHVFTENWETAEVLLGQLLNIETSDDLFSYYASYKMDKNNILKMLEEK